MKTVDLDPLRSAEVQAEVDRQDRHKVTSDQPYDQLERHRVQHSALKSLRAEIAGLHAQLEDLRQSKTVAALGRVASSASELLRAMNGRVDGLTELRHNLAKALGAFTHEAKADLAAASKRAVELQHGPLSKELAAEKATEGAACSECHGTKTVMCPRCKGSGGIGAYDFGTPPTVPRGKDAL